MGHKVCIIDSKDSWTAGIVPLFIQMMEIRKIVEKFVKFIVKEISEYDRI